MNGKKLKKILIPAGAVIGACALVWIGLVIYRNVSKKPVDVYPVSDFSYQYYEGDQVESYGVVKTDNMQNVTVSSTQTVTEIYVTEGQTVKAGDPLVAYDTTLSDIDLEKADINVQKLQLQLEQAQKDLVTLQNAQPYSRILVTPSESTVTYTSVQTPVVVSGSGTADDPYYYLWGSNDKLTFSLLQRLADDWESKKNAQPAEPADSGDTGDTGDTNADADTGDRTADTGDTGDTAEVAADDGKLYIAFVTRVSNALNAPIVSSWGLSVDMSSGEPVLQYYDPVLSEDILAYDEQEEPYWKESGTYTAAELSKMRSDKEQEIKDLEIQIKLAQLDLEKLQKEVSDGVVKSTLDGVVKAVRDPEECAYSGEPVVEVSAGGGYYIDVTMSEMDLGGVNVGDTVTVVSWNTGTVCEGTIVSVSEYPVSGSDSWSSGNNNVSWYPFRVFVDGEENLTENDYVSVSYTNTSGNEDAWYLQSMMIRSDGGKSYVYVVGENGKLEQRTVQTGRDLWGSYTEIRGGITPEDRIAFPYGTDVTTGAKVTDSTIDEFYSSAYGVY